MRTAVCAPCRPVLLVCLPGGGHSGLHSLWSLHRQLCAICTWCLGVTVEQTVLNTCTQTVVVVVLLAMDFWNCRVGSRMDPHPFHFPDNYLRTLLAAD